MLIKFKDIKTTVKQRFAVKDLLVQRSSGMLNPSLVEAIFQGRPGFWGHGIEGLSKSGIRYTSAEMCRYNTSFGYAVFCASINFGYIWRNLGYLGGILANCIRV